jgi:Kef-type K+ transport system membrane component KefB
LILSVGAILLAARGLGWAFQRIGQPHVVGEMIAGIVLGPSLLGRFFPGAFAYFFPSSSIASLAVLSQLGLLLFMFVVGLEVDLTHMLQPRAAVVLISNFSIGLPLALGVGLATALYPQFAGPGVAFSNLLGTSLGTVAISCAAIDDISAWLLLAILTAMVHSAQNWIHLAVTLLFLIAFVATMLIPIRRAVSFVESLYQRNGASVGLISVTVLIALAASWTTEHLGVHALFGAFMAGLIMPNNQRMTREIVERIESLSLALLLPLFFALTGLRTRIDLLTGRSMWGYTLAIMAIAVLGKLAGAAFIAKASGMKWKDSFGLGVLMNTRGLVELVILNAGLDLGILSPPLFTMMVIMALVTTLMTTPILMAMKIGRQGELAGSG